MRNLPVAGSGNGEFLIRGSKSQREVALELGITRQGVNFVERYTIRKLWRWPLVCMRAGMLEEFVAAFGFGERGESERRGI